jgi:hypothetical protein
MVTKSSYLLLLLTLPLPPLPPPPFKHGHAFVGNLTKRGRHGKKVVSAYVIGRRGTAYLTGRKVVQAYARGRKVVMAYVRGSNSET